MAQSILDKTGEIQGIVDDLGEVLGPSGEGYDIDDIAFKDWADVIRYGKSMTTEQAAKVSDALTSDYNIPSWSSSQTSKVLTDYLTNQNLTPETLCVRGSGTETLAAARLSKCWSTANESSSSRNLPLRNLSSLVVSDLGRVDVNALSGHTASGEYGGYEINPNNSITDFPLKKIVMRGVGYTNLTSFGSGMSNLEEIDYSGVTSVSDTVKLNGSIKSLDLSGITSTYDETSGATGNSIEISTNGLQATETSLERVKISKDFTGSITIDPSIGDGSGEGEASKLSRVEIPYGKETELHLAANARVKYNNNCFVASGTQGACRFISAESRKMILDGVGEMVSELFFVHASWEMVMLVVNGEVIGAVSLQRPVREFYIYGNRVVFEFRRYELATYMLIIKYYPRPGMTKVTTSCDDNGGCNISFS